MIREKYVMYILGLATGLIISIFADATQTKNISVTLEHPITAQVDFSMDDRLEVLE